MAGDIIPEWRATSIGIRRLCGRTDGSASSMGGSLGWQQTRRCRSEHDQCGGKVSTDWTLTRPAAHRCHEFGSSCALAPFLTRGKESPPPSIADMRLNNASNAALSPAAELLRASRNWSFEASRQSRFSKIQFSEGRPSGRAPRIRRITNPFSQTEQRGVRAVGKTASNKARRLLMTETRRHSLYRCGASDDDADSPACSILCKGRSRMSLARGILYKRAGRSCRG